MNDFIFNKIQSPNQAYWLGFLTADGSIWGEKIQIGLATKDIGHLEKFKKFLNSSNKISTKMNHCSNNNKYYSASYFTIKSRQIADDLEKYQIVESKSYKNINWLVADLADIPVMNGNVDFLINVLSPSNYDEFKRVLDKEGKLIKIIPNSDYLKEIRNIVFSNHKNKDYDNSEVIDLLEANFNKIEMIDISYKVKLNKEELNKLLDMTPLTWNLSDVEKEGIIKKNLSEITMSFKVLVGGFKTS